MGKALAFILFFNCCIISFSQTPIIVGKTMDLVDSTNVVDTRIFIKGTQLEQKTDINGEFVFEQDDIPIGQQVIRVSKQGYEAREFSIYLVQGKKLVLEKVGLLMTNDERKKRNEQRERNGEEKIKKKEIQEASSFLGKIPIVGGIGGETPILKGLFKKKRTEQDITFFYEDIPQEIAVEERVIEPSFSPLQLKYSNLMDVPPEKITNLRLYEFIDEWMGTPYLMGGNTESGIDCSSFALLLFHKIYDEYIGRTAQQMYDENWARKTLFVDPFFLTEGDLVFFNAGEDSQPDIIEHVGVYLSDNKFINATSRNGQTGVSGVKISDLSDSFWIRRFRAGGRVVE